MKRVAIIGAGPSGITAIKNFADQGFEVTAFDRCEGVGGNWRFNDPSGHSSVFETTHLISSKHTSFYQDFPLPENTPDYPSHSELLSYFNAYADHFDIKKLIKFNTEVTQCKKIDGERWQVEWNALGSDEKITEEFDALVVCNGHHHEPRYPDYPGEFTGELIHSHDFKSARPFQDKRVLVIGGGNSACDVAVETARVSKTTAISWRRGYYLIPKFMYGLPTDLQALKNRWMPDFIRGPFTEWMLEIFQGKNEDIGLQKPDKGLSATHPTVNSELYYAVRHGKVTPHVDIERYEGNEVIFKDGKRETFDVIIACTGFKIKHRFFEKSLVNYEEGKVPLLHKMIPADINNLYFIGLFQPLGCIWPGAELQSKLAAQHLLGNWKPKQSIKELIEKELANPDVKQIDTPRHTITVDDYSFRARLKKELKKCKAA
ncbi:flavin-containing monooxygenase [Umboniibacter marinipuniceus]|uniref:Flavin-binding monooxygenase-like protein n=1 Tax=Umboniibacter marinipuniceus TaxID=569599 RepID=A0A3M0A9H8_9GAMM|nr:NAD(P)-binding domain-containing protein [Umboniibacter marinipuniceus]RMA80954.1 flavin-binding monooxygenase-like protein [Umboniibacter marinipuniceus]